jgi:hypothetical protein
MYVIQNNDIIRSEHKDRLFIFNINFYLKIICLSLNNQITVNIINYSLTVVLVVSFSSVIKNIE